MEKLRSGLCRAMEADLEIHEELPEKHHLRKQIAATVRKIQWSYAIFWSISTRQPGVLAWSDGYYNGDIKTRKMTQPIELKADQIGLQRSEQLRELYESLSAGDSNQQTRRPSASLSPEDLTDAEWYYLVCMTFKFTLGQGLPGKALANKQHIWLNNAQFADSKIFSRSLLAKTVVCIPFMGGVLELGTTELILEDVDLVKQITSFFWELPNPICSEQSISSPQLAERGEGIICPDIDNGIDNSIPSEHHHLIADRQTPLESDPTHFPFPIHSYVPAEHTESVKVEELHQNICEEPDTCSPDDSSNECCLTHQLEDLLGADGLNGMSRTHSLQLVDDEFSNGLLHGSLSSDEHATMSFVDAQRAVSSATREPTRNQMLGGLQEGSHGKHISLDLDGDDSHYAETVATILRTSKLVNPVLCFLKVSFRSSFVVWRRGFNAPKSFIGTPQKLLKKILMDRAWWRGNHVLSERRRRDKLNEKFLALRSLVPTGGKIDKASILDDTTQYLKHLERRVQELESGTAVLGTTDRRKNPDVAERTSDNYLGNEITNEWKPPGNKRKACDMDEGEAEHHFVLSKHGPVHVTVTVKEKEVLVDLRCPWRECLLLEVVESMSNLHLDPISVQSSTVDGMLALTVKSKLRSSNVASPGMIKRSLQRVINKIISSSRRPSPLPRRDVCPTEKGNKDLMAVDETPSLLPPLSPPPPYQAGSTAKGKRPKHSRLSHSSFPKVSDEDVDRLGHHCLYTEEEFYALCLVMLRWRSSVRTRTCAVVNTASVSRVRRVLCVRERSLSYQALGGHKTSDRKPAAAVASGDDVALVSNGGGRGSGAPVVVVAPASLTTARCAASRSRQGRRWAGRRRRARRRGPRNGGGGPQRSDRAEAMGLTK
ncbi:anthocyanin regulatory Lc protein [Musa troglodytarum]|uniref:Anthocyanin regulatory Lc protein n=1 Tax=Musa troglodytarum TaxID=320322 RepID=A0A9E7HLQ6_9LILI|nr:anthocyanin regulatory Lc protein [Musa troglodytarum]